MGLWSVTWMVHWEDRRTVETGSHTGISVWRRLLCGVARMSCLPEFPDTAWLKCFRDIGKKCVLDLNAGETYTPVKSPERGVETVARMPFFSALPGGGGALRYGCASARLYADARLRGKWTFRKDCRERFGSTQSGTCTHCGKHIQQNLGKHVALYHMELAQLWQCPVTWCTVWKGAAQDCVDHMRRAHDIPPLVKAANLARWFPPWTVSREQWSSMSRPAVSGIAVDPVGQAHALVM